jgi:hypothetical protein
LQKLENRPFEEPDRKIFLFFSILCALIYPFLFGITKAANGQSLFVVRLIVALGNSAVAILIVIFMHKFIRASVEAVSESYDDISWPLYTL